MIRIANPDERREFDALMLEVVSEAEGTGERTHLMAAKIDDAVQAQRTWAVEVQRTAQYDGYSNAIKAYLKRTRVVINIADREVSKPRTIGTKRKDQAGTVVDLQLPLEVLTFDQIRDKRVEYVRQARAYTDNIAVTDRLLALQDMAPGANTPGEATKALGITLDEYLAGAA